MRIERPSGGWMALCQRISPRLAGEKEAGQDHDHRPAREPADGRDSLGQSQNVRGHKIKQQTAVKRILMQRRGRECENERSNHQEQPPGPAPGQRQAADHGQYRRRDRRVNQR